MQHRPYEYKRHKRRRTAFTRALAFALCICPVFSSTGNAADIDYNRDIVPILADKCYQCHGPDAEQRQAGLRLDTLDGATSETESGATAIVASDLASSELVARITSTDPDVRMPPPDHKQQLSAQEKRLLKNWIAAGAKWQLHWSLTRLGKTSPPKVSDSRWRRNSIDDFILAKLEPHQITPAPRTERGTLARRLYFDLLGLPPTRWEVQHFVEDNSPDAYERLVERLLASPHYGERWARHWLDVARYGDSNGGDENHAYPHAFRYRNYAIDTWNQDIPYDQFIQEQIAGDLLNTNSQPNGRTVRETLPGTGFLAIGMKILAERDPVKKRADMVDEQVDTVGRALLGLSFGCARCHDHKFDPISTADYYSLAGIFQSTEVRDRPLLTAEYAEQKQAFDNRMAELTRRRDDAEAELHSQLGTAGIMEREAESMDRGDATAVHDGYGDGIGIISDPGVSECFAEFDFDIPQTGTYVLQLRYAAENARPGDLLIDGEVISTDIMSTATGGWYPQHQQWITEQTLSLKKGPTVLRLNARSNMVHIDKLRLIYSADNDPNGAADRAIAKFDAATKAVAELEKRKPEPIQVMAVGDGEVRDIQIHNRGSHLDLGEYVARQFPVVLSANVATIPPNESGRVQMARWLTDKNDGAGHLLARVIANRIWHWHFGRGLVATPDDFGIRGSRPTHPQLLDSLATYLIDNNWSIKSLHRLIVTSATYQMRSQHRNEIAQAVDPSNELYWRGNTNRIDAESIRDSLIASTQQLDGALGGESITVKSQDPSPADLEANTIAYEAMRRRSVYLPIVRSNVYELLTLFDFPNAASPVGKRDETVVPTQALMLLNSRFAVSQSEKIVATIAATTDESTDENFVDELYWRLLSRQPSNDERNDAVAFTNGFALLANSADSEQTATVASRVKARVALCQTLLMSNEFLFVD